MRTDSGLFQFSVFSRLPLGGRLLAKQGGEGRRYPHPCKQSGEQLQHLLSPLGRVANESEPREVCLNSPSFRGFPLGGGSLRSKVVRGVVLRIPASRAASECEQIAVCFNSPSFRGFPLGGGSLRSKVVRGVVLRIPASRAASECEPIAVFKTYIPPPACLQKIHFFKPFKMQKKYLQ